MKAIRTAIAIAGLIANGTVAAADGAAECWAQMERQVLGELNETGSFLYYSDEGELARGEYHNQTIYQSEPERGVFVVEYDFPDMDYSGSIRFDVEARTLETSSLEPATIEVDSIECMQPQDGVYSGVRHFRATAGGISYDFQESMVVTNGVQHFVQSTRPAGTDELFVPAGVHFATRK